MTHPSLLISFGLGLLLAFPLIARGDSTRFACRPFKNDLRWLRCMGSVETYPKAVAILIPLDFDEHEAPEALLYLHGHNLESLPLEAILDRTTTDIEGNIKTIPRNRVVIAPHSTGRCLEFRSHLSSAAGFNRFVSEAIAEAKAIAHAQTIPFDADRIQRLSVAGHSGAYLPISKLLASAPEAGPVNWQAFIQSVVLLDATYGESNAFVEWTSGDPGRRFWSAYIPASPTERESLDIQRGLKLRGIPFYSEARPSTEVRDPAIFRENRIGFIQSGFGHSATVGAFLGPLISH